MRFRPTPLQISLAALVGCVVFVVIWQNKPKHAATVDFNRDVRPILSDRCFGCHGPDANKGRKAGLRLDEAESAGRKLKSGAIAIIPGDLKHSEMARRILSQDPEELMPSPELHRPLSQTEKNILLKWIEEGADYKPHWAFVSPVKHEPPQTQSADWAKDPIDRFILAKIEQAGLQPAPIADKTTLLRRASLALTGLPPTPKEVDTFLADTAPDAFSRRVDAMLASPRYGEHLAVGWMDLSRYADSWGYTGDGSMLAWPWRDWVLKAFNENMPCDRFLTEQLAGDLLPNSTHSQKIATAYNRIHRMTFEGGSIAEEFRQDGIGDRVATAGYGFMGLTLECSRCHDHKYDPIAQKDYYAMAAMFGDIDENGLLSYHGEAPAPFVRLLKEPELVREQELLRTIEQADRLHLNAVTNSLSRPATQLAIKDLPAPVALYHLEPPGKLGYINDAPNGKPARGGVTAIDGIAGKGVAFDGDGGLLLDGLEKFGRYDPVSFSAHLKLGEKNNRATLLHASDFYTGDGDASGLELIILDGRLRWSVIHLWPNSAVSIETTQAMAVQKWQHITATYDGSSKACGLHLYLDGQELPTRVIRDTLDAPVREKTLQLGYRSRDAGFRNGAMDEVTIWRTALTSIEVAKHHNNTAHDFTDAQWREHFALREDPEVRQTQAALWKAQRELSELQDKAPRLPCMKASANAPKTYVLTRGQYDQPKLDTPIEPGVPTRIFPWNENYPRNRLGLSKWLTDPKNPLTARLTVNRLWTQIFGTGIVPSSENLGLQSDSPTHPELLDTLSVEFIESGWDIKALLRRMVLSATFAQSSTATPEAREKDPANKLLSHGPVLRLSAEMVRDQALQAASLLVEKVGGESVQESAYRRGLYTYRKRTAPPDSMLIFDAGSRETCQPRRLTTNTPLQALVLMNNRLFVDAASKIALNAQKQHPTDVDQQITLAFRLICTRVPRPAEFAALKELYVSQKANPSARAPIPIPPPVVKTATPDPKVKKADAKEKKVETPKPPEPGPALPLRADQAALAMVCSTILASDAAVTSR